MEDAISIENYLALRDAIIVQACFDIEKYEKNKYWLEKWERGKKVCKSDFRMRQIKNSIHTYRRENDSAVIFFKSQYFVSLMNGDVDGMLIIELMRKNIQEWIKGGGTDERRGIKQIKHGTDGVCSTE